MLDLEYTSEQRLKRIAVVQTILDLMQATGCETYADLIRWLAGPEPTGSDGDRTASVERVLQQSIASVHGVGVPFVTQVLHEVAVADRRN